MKQFCGKSVSGHSSDLRKRDGATTTLVTIEEKSLTLSNRPQGGFAGRTVGHDDLELALRDLRLIVSASQTLFPASPFCREEFW
jgi:hypothetical protein